jgi:hypothetical protein
MPRKKSASVRSGTLIPVDVQHVDLLISIAREFGAVALILDAAAVGDPTLAAVNSFLSPMNERLQEFKQCGFTMPGVQ